MHVQGTCRLTNNKWKLGNENEIWMGGSLWKVGGSGPLMEVANDNATALHEITYARLTKLFLLKIVSWLELSKSHSKSTTHNWRRRRGWVVLAVFSKKNSWIELNSLLPSFVSRQKGNRFYVEEKEFTKLSKTKILGYCRFWSWVREYFLTFFLKKFICKIMYIIIVSWSLSQEI